MRWPLTRRVRWIGGLALLACVTILAVGWAIATPEIGEPYQNPSTASPRLWSFGFVGDTQLGGERVEEIFRRLHDENVEFVLHLGDMVDEAASDGEWDTLLAQAARQRIRLMPVVGNHDHLLDHADDGSIRFRQYFPALPSTFYHFRHRGLNFLMLNSERSLLPTSEQGRFVRWQLSHHPGTTVVCLHRPVFTCGKRDLAKQVSRRVWLHGALAESDVVAVLSGHHHYYDRTKPLDGITYVVSGGGSQKLYEHEKSDDRTATFRSGHNHYGVVEVFADHLRVRAIDLDGEELDRFELPLKPTDHEPGSYHNRWATELPPLDELPSYASEALETFTAGRPLPRPW